MSSTPLQIEGVQITTPAEFLRFLDHDDHNPRSRNGGSRNSTERPEIARTSSRMFALIIGINEYRSMGIPKLWGAVPDALAIKNYLETRLNVQDSHIQMLCDEDATRQNIIDGLIALRDNDDIQWGDAILIYFAGHGVELGAPVGWVTGNKRNLIQGIVPHDYDLDKNIHVIPDRTVCWLIDDINQNRGDNITLILDSCHCGFEVRGEHHENMARTVILNNYSIPADVDKNIGNLSTNSGDRSRTLLTGFNGTGLSPSSHVLLAACSVNEAARERNGRGQFTLSLENALKTTSPDQMTYVELFDRLENIVGQNPQLKGNNQHRKVFNSKAAVPVHHVYKLVLDSGDYILHAGAADGICANAEFTVYANHEGIFKDPHLSVMVPEDIRPFTTIMRPISDPPHPDKAVLAVQTKAGTQEELKIYMRLSEDLIPVFDSMLIQMKEPGSNPNRIALVEDQSAAHLELQRDGNQIRFIILDKRVTVHGLTECVYKANANAQDLRLVLQGAAHYYYHLNRSYLNSETENIERDISIEIFRMEITGIDEMTGRPLKRPCGENLLKNGTVWIDVRCGFEDDLYGIKITNNGPVNLYSNIFYFDNSELSIGDCYKSGGPTKFTVDSPLTKKGGTLALGYGGSQAYQYYIPPGRDVDIGFLKCFFTNLPIDLSNIPQTTPFEPRRSGESLEQLSRGLKIKPPSNIFGCVLIPVVQKRVG